MAITHVYVPGEGLLIVGDPEPWDGRLHPNYRLVAEIQQQVHAQNGHPQCPICQFYPTFDLRTGWGYCARCGRTLVEPQQPPSCKRPIERERQRQAGWLRRWRIRPIGHWSRRGARQHPQPGQRVCRIPLRRS